jgi:hypothetical protein
MSDNNDLILSSLQQLHSDLSTFRSETNTNFSDMKQRTTALETQVVPFFANDGDLNKMKDQIDSLNRTKWYGLGALGVLSTGVHYILHKLGV